MSNPVYQKVAEMLDQHPDALEFLKGYHELCHAVDDIVDEKRTDVEFISHTFILAAAVYSCPFYRRYVQELFPMVCHVTNNFTDSTIMLDNPEDWQQKFGDAIRNTANDMVCCVVNICCGWKEMRKVSMLLREDSYAKHHDCNDKPI
jgi:hypothetical protein